MQNIIFIAPPAAGKGTLSNLIEEKYHMPHISMGDILRNKTKENSEEALYIKNLIDKGSLISDDIANRLMEERLNQDDTNDGFILDGYPRTIDQAIKLENVIKKLDKGKSVVIFLNIDEEEALKRILGRIICPKCHKVYNKFKTHTAPKVEGICNICGTSLTLRADDNSESFKKRFETYIEITKPLLEYYDTKGMLYTIQSIDTPNEMLMQIEQVLEGIK